MGKKAAWFGATSAGSIRPLAWQVTQVTLYEGGGTGCGTLR